LTQSYHALGRERGIFKARKAGKQRFSGQIDDLGEEGFIVCCDAGPIPTSHRCRAPPPLDRTCIPDWTSAPLLSHEFCFGLNRMPAPVQAEDD
jgi:hypothetical protein